MISALRWGWVVSITPRSLYPWERPVTYCTRGWVGPRTGLDVCGKSRPPPGFDPRTVQPLASRYTDCAIPALIIALINTLMHTNISLAVRWSHTCFGHVVRNACVCCCHYCAYSDGFNRLSCSPVDCRSKCDFRQKSSSAQEMVGSEGHNWILSVRILFLETATSADNQGTHEPITVMCWYHRRPREPNIFYVLPVAFGGVSIAKFC